MPAITDLLRRGAAAFSTTLSAQKAAGASSASISSATGIPTTTAIEITVGRVDSNGTKTPATKAIYKGTLSGTTVSNLTLIEGTDQLHAAGTPVEIIFTASQWNDMITWGLTQHNQDGTHGAVTTTSINNAGALTQTGVATFTAVPLLPANTVETADIQASAVTTAKIADANITFAKLLSTIFSGQVTTLTNAGTAGGTMYYINLGGIKILWGKTASQAVGIGGATWTVTLPSFFTTIQASLVTQDVLGTSIQQNAYITSITTSTMTIGQWAVANGSSQANSFLIIGT